MDTSFVSAGACEVRTAQCVSDCEPWSGSPQNEAVELPISQACLEEEPPVQEVWETLIIHFLPEGILYPPERSF